MPKYRIKIVSDPPAVIQLRAGASVTLQAFAYDDSGNPIRLDADRVSWHSSSGTGAALTDFDPPDITRCRVSAASPGISVVGTAARICGKTYGQNVTIAVL